MTSTRSGFETAVFAAYGLLSLTVIWRFGIAAAVAAALVLIASRVLAGWEADVATRVRDVALAMALFLFVFGLAVRPGGDVAFFTAVFIAPLAIAVAYISIRGSLEEPLVRWLGAALLVAIIAVIAIFWILLTDRPEIDVLDLHVSAAETLLDGRNPYADARAPDTNPYAESGSEVVGYPYPPVTMVPFVAAQFLFGDPRWAGVIAVVLTVLLIVRPWAPRRGHEPGAMLAIGLAVVVLPVIGHIFRQGWTEPIALPLLAGVALLWRKHPALAAVLLGLTLGLKQYWIVAVPLLLVWGDDERWRRLWIAGGVAALSLVPAFLPDAGAAWDSMVVALMEVPPRLDSIGLTGLGLDPPFLLVLLFSAAVAVWMGLPGGSSARFQIALATTLSTAFLFGSQAFVNYWFLIAGMTMVGLAVSVGDSAGELDGHAVDLFGETVADGAAHHREEHR